MSAPVSIHLYERLAEDASAYIGDMTPILLHDWRRVTRAAGGYWVADSTITEAEMTTNDMINFFTWNIGRRVVERTYGATVSWEGEITQMDFTYRGITYQRTLRPELFQNKVKVTYRDSTSKTSTATAWATTILSEDMFGTAAYIDVVGDNYDATNAAALRSRRLADYAWPGPRPMRGLSSDRAASTSGGNKIAVLCAGYVHSMNRIFRESDTAAGNASDQISTLVGESDFVTVGTIDENTLQVPLNGSEIPFKLWEGIEEIIDMGDGTNRWAGGVYGGRVFDYHAAETEVEYYWKDHHLHNRAMLPIIAPSLIRPDIIMRLSETPFQTNQSGGNVWDSAMNAYIEQVEFIAPNVLILTPKDVL